MMGYGSPSYGSGSYGAYAGGSYGGGAAFAGQQAGGYASQGGGYPPASGSYAPAGGYGHPHAVAYPQAGGGYGGAHSSSGYGAVPYAPGQGYSRRDGGHPGFHEYDRHKGGGYGAGPYGSAAPACGSYPTGGMYGCPPSTSYSSGSYGSNSYASGSGPHQASSGCGGSKGSHKASGRSSGSNDKAGRQPNAPTGAPDNLTVSGCQHGTVGGIVRGNFTLSAENHGRPVYKKDTQENGLDVMLYYWDDRDGPNFCGWWFGPKVGGDQVWAYHPNKDTSTPPAAGWKVPYDGPVDQSFTITPKTSAVSSTTRPADTSSSTSQQGSWNKQAKQNANQAQQQQRQQQQQQQAGSVAGHQQQSSGRPPNWEQQEAEKRKSEEERKKVEEEQSKKNEELRRKKDLEDKRRQEQKSTLAIRRVIQKVRMATPENFDEFRKEMEEVLEQELENTGTQKSRISEESDKGLEQARKRIEQVNEQRKKEQEKKESEDKKRSEQEDKSRELVKALTDLVEAAEVGAQTLQETAAPLQDNSDLSVQDVETTAKAVEKAGLDAKLKTKACTDFILQKGPDMKDPPTTQPNAGPSETKQSLAKLLARINECTRLAEATVLGARGAKDKAVRRAAARQKTKEMEATFEKYDKDADDMLSRKEVVAYSKGEFKFTIPEDTLESIWKNVVEDGNRGVKLDRFQWLKVIVGIARERARDRNRRREREEKESVLKDIKAELQEKIKEAGRAVDAADQDVAKCEKVVQPLMLKARTMAAPDMIALSDETDDMIKEAKAAVVEARKQIDTVSEDFDERFEADLRAFVAAEAKQLEMRMGRMDSRLSRATNLSGRFREQAMKKRAIELEKLRAAALKVIRYNQRIKKATNEDIFQDFDKNKDGTVDEKEFLQFFETADKDVKELEDLLPSGDKAVDGDAKEEGTDGALKDESNTAKDDDGKEEVPKSENGEDDKSIKEAATKNGETSEKVDLNAETISRLFGYLDEEGEGCLSKEMFMRLIRLYMKVVKETVMTAEMSIKDSKAMRRLELDEVVEVLQGPMKDDTVDVHRIRARVMTDGTEGFVTIAGNHGTMFLKEGGSLFKVLKETILTESFELDADKESSRKLKDTTRKLKEGELLEVHEWPRKEEKSGLIRMKAKARSDGVVGWITTTGNTGTVFVEVL